MNISVKITGDKELVAKLNKLDREVKNFSKAFRQLGDDLVKYYSNNVFASMGGVFGIPWMKLSPSTVAQKVKHYRQYAAVPLVATGAMKDSFRAQSDEKTLTIDNPTPYFVYHQSTDTRSKLPRRQMLGFNNELKRLIENVIKEDIKEKIASL